MPSVFEAFGWKKQSSYTAITPLGINNRINRLQIQSQKYFIVEENARAADGNILAVTLISGQNFDLINEEHRTHLRACMALFKEKANDLKALDRKIAYSMVLGVIATSLSFIPFVGYFGLLGWGSALYHLNQRTTASIEYQESLNLLVATCNWALGQGANERRSDKDALTTNSDIREMMISLYPVLNEQQVRHLIADDIEEVFTQELRNYEHKYQLTANAHNFFSAGGDERIAQGKRSAEFNRCIYGYNKGNPTDYLDAFLSIFPDIYNAIHYGFKRLQHWWSKDAAPQAAKEQSQLTVSK